MYVQSDGNDIFTDVVVLGTGPGGLAATASAVENGAQVVVIEAHDKIGGNGLLSTGWVSFVNSKLQRSLGIEDSPELFLKDCDKLVATASKRYGLQYDLEIAKLYAEESHNLYDILTERGVRFSRLIKRPLQTSVDRLAAVEDTSMFPAAFKQEFEGPNVKAYLRCVGERLIMDGQTAIGVQVRPRDSGKAFNVWARKGVVLATGGYGANPALRRHFQVDPRDMSIFSGLSTCRGDGQLIGQAVGGDLTNMTMIPPIVAVASHLTEEAIAVNLDGNRFHDEAGPYDYRVQELEKQVGQAAHFVFDSKTFESKQKYVLPMAGDLVQAATLSELAIKLGVPGPALEQSVREWNAFLESDQPQDPKTGRVQFTPERRPIAQAPFYSKPMVVGISLTCGGFITTNSMQVVDVWGEAVPGLFAVGDCAGGLTPTAEMGGTHLGGGFVLGWIAGKAIATGNLCAPHTIGTFGQCQSQMAASQPRIPIVSVPEAHVSK
ncbi:succinate dehydrogenase [Mariannaea sp. PMI_226]|nr:succinate dehydrogenase [Mariannaea sp. PMI_226]